MLNDNFMYAQVQREKDLADEIYLKQAPISIHRLRELAEADMAGRCVVLPVKPGEAVRFAKNPRAKHEKVACVTLYEGGKIRLGFHDVGYKETWVDEWSEDAHPNEAVPYQTTLTPPDEPLTPEQLREMNGQPVWVEEINHWALIDIETGGRWSGIPFVVWAENGAKFCYNIKARNLHCYRCQPKKREEMQNAAD